MVNKRLLNLSQAQIDSLIAKGYRRTSRRYGMVSRIDREDWMDHLATKLHVPVEKLKSDKPGQWEDFYRRVCSKDHKALHPKAALRVPASQWDAVGYVPLQSIAHD